MQQKKHLEELSQYSSLALCKIQIIQLQRNSMISG